MRTLVVIPTYEEAANVVEVLHRVRAPRRPTSTSSVDDNSPDGTAALARTTATELGGIDVLVQRRRTDSGAYRHGFEVGLGRGYDVLLQMDADLSHDPAAIPALLADRGRHGRRHDRLVTYRAGRSPTGPGIVAPCRSGAIGTPAPCWA